MKRRNNNTSQSGEVVDVSNATLLKEDEIGNKKIAVYTEWCEHGIDFFFTINGSFFRSVKEYNISELYKVYSFVQQTLVEYIENEVLTLIKNGSKVDILIGACGATTQEIESKNQVYKRQLDKLAKKYNCTIDVVDGDYILRF